MEIRKFIIELHPDHFMNKFKRLCNTADDIVHVGNYSKDYQAGARDAINYLLYHFTR